MKVLIWFLCALGYSLVTTVLNALGLNLGGIPTIIVASVFFWLARRGCKAIDVDRQADENTTDSQETVEFPVVDPVLPETDVPVICDPVIHEPIPQEPTPSPKKTKQRYCKYCGGAIDPVTKVCEKCGKQYFRFPHSKRFFTVSILILLVALTISIFILILQYQQLRSLKNEAANSSLPVSTEKTSSQPSVIPQGPDINLEELERDLVKVKTKEAAEEFASGKNQNANGFSDYTNSILQEAASREQPNNADSDQTKIKKAIAEDVAKDFQTTPTYDNSEFTAELNAAARAEYERIHGKPSRGIEFVTYSQHVAMHSVVEIGISANPYALYEITITDSSGRSISENLPPQYSNGDGCVTWSWAAVSDTCIGKNKITIAGDGQEASIYFEVK